jgi:ubiquinol-cytochrome c reductase cytochrome b subunit
VEERTGAVTAVRRALEEPVHGGARWAYVFGSGATFLLLVQTVTGVLLATAYAPTTTDAWASVRYIQHELTLGWLVRGLHHYGASAMIVAVALHALQVLAFGAYKRPRELNWVTGAMLLLVVLGFALTGYLLPWDQKGYWATRVATSIAGTTPIVGEAVQTVLVGGPEYGNFTLTRFYATHVLVLPVLAAALVGVHVMLFRRHGVTPAPGRPAEELATAEPFWPGQALRDLVYMVVLFLAVCGCFVAFGAAPLEAPADPSSDYVARPEWYFLALFQLVKLFEGPLVVVGTIVIPGAATAFVFAMPFLDRSASRRLADRRRVAAAVTVGLGAWTALTVTALRSDARNPALRRQQERAVREAAVASDLAGRFGVPAEGPAALWSLDPVVDGERLFERHCLECHSLSGRGADECADLTGYGSPAWIAAFIRDPADPRLLGRRGYEATMPANPAIAEADVAALAHHVAALAGEVATGQVDTGLAERGRRLVEEGVGECLDCHAVDPEEDATDGPHLAGYGSREWVAGLIADAGHGRYFGDANEMPVFADTLDDMEIDHIAAYVTTLRRRAGPLPAPPRPGAHQPTQGAD